MNVPEHLRLAFIAVGALLAIAALWRALKN
jgi:hypothetical protein